MFWCDTCKVTDPDRCSCVNVAAMTSGAQPNVTLDELAADVRRRRREEGQAADEANLLRRLADEARGRYEDAQRRREMAESAMRMAYNESVMP